MPTLNFVLKTDKQNNKGLVPIYLRITVNRKSRYISSDISIPEKYWDSKTQKVRSSHHLSESYNQSLFYLMSEAYAEFNKLKFNQKLNAESLQKKLRGEDPTNIFTYGRSHIEILIKKNQYWEEKKYKVLLNKLKSFTGNEDLTFGELDVRFLTDFEIFMIKKCKNKANTRAKMFDKLKKLYRMALEEELISNHSDPFRKFTYKREKTHKAKLSENQLNEIEQINLKAGSLIWHVRNYFMFSFYCAGIRFGDLCQLRWSNIYDKEYLSYVMDKTGRKKTIILSSQVQKILDHYRAAGTKNTDFLFPLLDNDADYSDIRFLKRRISARNALVNKYLKKIAKRISLNESLSFHVARHSFADFARTKGVDIYSISKALGHSSLSITEGYLKSLDQQSVDRSIMKLFRSNK